ncbi:hypothetical protein KAW18_01940 [candidate division WOR-3 bacterium]|nr:hypothetical protein [candidate division WOR-3 bacterium]
MKFEEILSALRTGKKVRRESWHRADSITYEWDSNLSKLRDMPHGGHFQYHLPLEDLNADDWEIKDENWKPKSKGTLRDLMEEIECDPKVAEEVEENQRRNILTLEELNRRFTI